ncbi:predicted protein [Histoplasma capsulatum var. duboisii H88]|uniref:Predicted protein n=1 Tax=Ajellomyces capsulatus (strain H88) TaxID=544711 RepID=F0UUE6_AJEC8|nr:predicted protein [Histoplasma capsulatum var. duboisii H88]
MRSPPHTGIPWYRNGIVLTLRKKPKMKEEEQGKEKEKHRVMSRATNARTRRVQTNQSYFTSRPKFSRFEPRSDARDTRARIPDVCFSRKSTRLRRRIEQEKQKPSGLFSARELVFDTVHMRTETLRRHNVR